MSFEEHGINHNHADLNIRFPIIGEPLPMGATPQSILPARIEIIIGRDVRCAANRLSAVIGSGKRYL